MSSAGSSTQSLPHHLEPFHVILVKHPICKLVSIKLWHKLLGELCSMTLAISGGLGLFPLLQHALSIATGNHVYLSPPMHDQLDNFCCLAAWLGKHPSWLAETALDHMMHKGTIDTASTSMGSVWIHPTEHPNLHPLWHQPFLLDIHHEFFSFANPTSTITSLDHELAAPLPQMMHLHMLLMFLKPMPSLALITP